ncbi:MAG: hypothetical protein RhofKO_37900 [Rhodothermales bacterium]
MQLRLLSVGLLALLVIACEDPTGVGSTLVEEQTGQPRVVTEIPTELTPKAYNDFTGDSRRILVGQVDDPIFGQSQATGYFDVGIGDDINGDFTSNTISAASLELRVDYVYGDTLTPITIRVRDMDAAWTSAGVTTDTTLTPGAEITTFSFAPTDTLVSIPLPASWISANQAQLRVDNADFTGNFHGFQIDAVDGNAIVGFQSDESSLQATAGSTTVTYVGTRSATTTERLSEPAGLDGYQTIQDGVGPGLRFNFDLTDIALSALNRTIIRVRADSVALQQNLPANFVRPELPSLELIVVDENGLEIRVQTKSPDEDGVFTFDANGLRSVIQELLLGEVEVQEFGFALTHPDGNSASALLVHDIGSVFQPEALLTLTPFSN